MPLDKLYINNITRIVGGVKEIIPVDTTKYRLTGNSTECLVKSARRLRQLQGSSSSESVQVDYTVLDPPQEYVDLTSDDLTTILATSDVVTSVAASVGGTSVSASIEIDMIAQDAPQPTPTPTPSKSVFQDLKDKISEYILGGGLGGGLAMVSLGVALFMWRRHVNKKRRARWIQENTTHYTNPIVNATVRPVKQQTDILYMDDNTSRGITSPRIVIFDSEQRVAMGPTQVIGNRV